MKAVLRWYFASIIGAALFTAGVVTGIAIEFYHAQIIAKAGIADGARRIVAAQRNH